MGRTAYINNKPYLIREGETILSFVRRHLAADLIPTLCDAPNLEPFGSCRICSVEVALEKGGKRKTVASCHTPVMVDSYIYPDSEDIQELRRNIIELAVLMSTNRINWFLVLIGE